jgi:predicted amidophosphoribosyltransferase
MALQPCKECQQPVSTTARWCPHCGATYPARDVRDDLRRIGPAIVIAVLVGLGAAYLAMTMMVH